MSELNKPDFFFINSIYAISKMGDVRPGSTGVSALEIDIEAAAVGAVGPYIQALTQSALRRKRIDFRLWSKAIEPGAAHFGSLAMKVRQLNAISGDGVGLTVGNSGPTANSDIIFLSSTTEQRTYSMIKRSDGWRQYRMRADDVGGGIRVVAEVLDGADWLLLFDVVDDGWLDPGVHADPGGIAVVGDQQAPAVAGARILIDDAVMDDTIALPAARLPYTNGFEVSNWQNTIQPEGNAEANGTAVALEAGSRTGGSGTQVLRIDYGASAFAHRMTLPVFDGVHRDLEIWCKPAVVPGGTDLIELYARTISAAFAPGYFLMRTTFSAGAGQLTVEIRRNGPANGDTLIATYAAAVPFVAGNWYGFRFKVADNTTSSKVNLKAEINNNNAGWVAIHDADDLSAGSPEHFDRVGMIFVQSRAVSQSMRFDDLRSDKVIAVT